MTIGTTTLARISAFCGPNLGKDGLAMGTITLAQVKAFLRRLSIPHAPEIFK
jgi:hypothetical protein